MAPKISFVFLIFQEFYTYFLFSSGTKTFSRLSDITVNNSVKIHWTVWICMRNEKSGPAFIVEIIQT